MVSIAEFVNGAADIMLHFIPLFFHSEVEPQRKSDWFWHDSEGNRDATKTKIATRYRVTASLENTKSEDYFTEKRYQALFANSIPLVFKNHNSADFLPGSACVHSQPALVLSRMRLLCRH